MTLSNYFSLPTYDSLYIGSESWMLGLKKWAESSLLSLIRPSLFKFGFIFIFCMNFSIFSKECRPDRKAPPPNTTSQQIAPTTCFEKKHFRLSYRMGYFLPNNKVIRKIYHHGISYQLEFDWNFWKGFYFFSNADYFSNSGHSLNFHSDTQIRIVGWLNGFGYLYKWASWIGLYAGIGPKAFFYYNHDHAPYVKENISKTTAGFGTKTGFLFFPYKCILVDLFADYSYGRVHFKNQRSSNILRFSTNAGGLTIGGGIGAQF